MEDTFEENMRRKRRCICSVEDDVKRKRKICGGGYMENMRI